MELEETLKKAGKTSGLNELSQKQVTFIKLSADGKYSVDLLDEHNQSKPLDLGESFNGVVIYNRKKITEFPPSDGRGINKPILASTNATKNSHFVSCRMSGLVDTLAKFKQNNPNAKVETVLGVLVIHKDYDLKFGELTLKASSVSTRNPNNISAYIDECNLERHHVSLCVTKFGHKFAEYEGRQYVYNSFAFEKALDEERVKKEVQKLIEDDMKRYEYEQKKLEQEYNEFEGRNRAAPVNQPSANQPPAQTINSDDIPF